jgi:hypothetical protein
MADGALLGLGEFCRRAEFRILAAEPGRLKNERIPGPQNQETLGKGTSKRPLRSEVYLFIGLHFAISAPNRVQRKLSIVSKKEQTEFWI